jgi:hypothetical protein
MFDMLIIISCNLLKEQQKWLAEYLRFKRDILGFVVQYETRLEGKWLPVVRYDTRHGFAHRDLLDKKGKKRKTPMFSEDYSEALTFAEYDIQSNWRLYKQHFLKGA